MRISIYVTGIIVLLAGCRKAYYPPAIASPNNYLVVEGFINSGKDSTIIRVSRAVNISSTVSSKPELHAIVTVQGDQDAAYPLIEAGNGKYACAGLNLNPGHKYRLSIKTSNNEQYLSDYQTPLNSPLIDSVSYDTKGALAMPGVNITVNTHDAANNVQYYRWDYSETWIIHASYISAFKSNGDTVLVRDLVNDNISVCWQRDSSSNIVLGSTAKLSQNVIAANPITFIESTSNKLGFEYSILVTQYALTKDAYTFYTNLKKNSEQLGSIFDAQPTEIRGNIHCITNPAEAVIGYISVGSTATQRIFITTRLLPFLTKRPTDPGCALAVDPADPLSQCCYYSLTNTLGQHQNEVDQYINYNIGGDLDPLIPVGAIGMPGHPPIGFTATTEGCVDCTTKGTNKQPAFWQYK